MGTTLDLIAEIRRHVAARSTGRMAIRFPDRRSHVLFQDGRLSFDGPDFGSYLEVAPVDFAFEPGPVRIPAGAAGEQVLLDALDGLGADTLARIWEPYRDWTVSFLQDPAVHGSTVATHFLEDPERLARLLRLAVIGVLGIEPPTEPPIEEELERVTRAALAGDPWTVLGLPPFSSRTEIKRQYRKLARQLHPDRWPMLEDGVERQRVVQAFREVRVSYERAMDLADKVGETAVPRPRVVVPEGIVGEPVGGNGPASPHPGNRPSSGAADAVRVYDAPPGNPTDSLFRRIFETLTKKAS